MPGNKKFSQEEINLIMSMKDKPLDEIKKAVKAKFSIDRTEKGIYQRIKWVEKLQKDGKPAVNGKASKKEAVAAA